jgi:hypothetical protein
MGSPFASFRTKPLMLEVFCADKKVKEITIVTFKNRMQRNNSEKVFMLMA